MRKYPDDFENVFINGVFASQYIASWLSAGGRFPIYEERARFIKWLMHIGLDEEDARFVANLAETGKLELEEHAKRWLRTH